MAAGLGYTPQQFGCDLTKLQNQIIAEQTAGGDLNLRATVQIAGGKIARPPPGRSDDAALAPCQFLANAAMSSVPKGPCLTSDSPSPFGRRPYRE
jgi:hypothetical protein